MKQKTFGKILLFIGFSGLIFIFVYSSNTEKPEKFPEDCSNLTLVKTAQCLNLQVKSFYVYNKSNQYVNMTEEKLKNEGGTCWAWADYYAEHAEELGFYTEKPVIKIYKNTSGKLIYHEFAVISDYSSYCVIDQNSVVGCFNFETNKSLVNKSEIRNI